MEEPVAKSPLTGRLDSPKFTVYYLIVVELIKVKHYNLVTGHIT